MDYCNKNEIVVQAYCPLVRGEKWGHPVLEELSKRVSLMLLRGQLLNSDYK